MRIRGGTTRGKEWQGSDCRGRDCWLWDFRPSLRFFSDREGDWIPRRRIRGMGKERGIWVVDVKVVGWIGALNGGEGRSVDVDGDVGEFGRNCERRGRSNGEGGEGVRLTVRWGGITIGRKVRGNSANVALWKRRDLAGEDRVMM